VVAGGGPVNSILSWKLSAIILTSNCGLNDILYALNNSLDASGRSLVRIMTGAARLE